METPPPSPPRPTWTLTLPGGRRLHPGGHPLVMGILNLTPDSFSDGGLYTDPGRAAERGLAMLAEGADLLDLGAESTRPGGGVYGGGAREVPVEEEWARLAPVLTRLRRESASPLSVDTRKGEVARRALAEGADLVNDVSAGADPALLSAVAEAGCPVVLMHSRGDLATMQREIRFSAVVAEVRDELLAAAGRARGLGVGEGQIVFDPGIGFGKTAAQNLLLLKRLDALAPLGRPVLVGASRKSFLAAVLDGRPGPEERLAGSLAAAAWAAAGGAAVLRVHDVRETVDFLRVWSAISGSADGAEQWSGAPSPAGVEARA